MSELITSENLDLVVSRNRVIKDDVQAQALKLQTTPLIMRVASAPQLALLILQGFGLVQLPVEDRFFSGAIYVKNGKVIPVLNTALPRANQYFAAWHEIYHLIFDNISIDHIIRTDNILEERKAEYFAACMLLNGVDKYYNELPEMDFIHKVFNCMSMFQAPYKAVLISLYEHAVQTRNDSLCSMIKRVFDLKIDDMPEKFRNLGLDDSLVRPSYVVNTISLQERIHKNKVANPELNYHKDNEDFLLNIKREMNIVMRRNE